MTEKTFELKINVPMIKELVSDKIYRSDASAFREQYVNALSHGCIAYHDQFGYTDDVNVHVEFDYGLRKVTVTDNGMGMDKTIFSDNFMSFGFSTVDKETNNTRSGMFGLGAISFFRIASACIVESWDRKTDERFTFMTRNTDESEFVENRTLTGPGTKTEIFLKEHVRIDTLVSMVKKIAGNYPVKTILEIVNSEQEQTIASYKNTDEDSYDEFQPTMRFKDYVSQQTSGRFTQIVNDDEMELYLSTTGRNKNHTYLCRVPIDVHYTTGFTTFLNIKKEKINGEDSKGNFKLQEVPKPDRDEVNEIAEEYFSTKIEKLCDDMIASIDITSYEQYLASEQRWILNGYSVDDKLNAKTHAFVQQLREPVRIRNSDKIQKRSDSILNVLSNYKHVYHHPSMHKGTFMAIDLWHKRAAYNDYVKQNTPEVETALSTTPEEPVIVESQLLTFEQYNYSEVAFIDDPKGLPIKSAKQFKKDQKIPAVHPISSGGSVSGLLVREGRWNNHRLSAGDEITKRYPGGLYYGEAVMGQWNISDVSTRELEERKNPMARIIHASHSGIVAAKAGKKSLTSIFEWRNHMIKQSTEGKIIHSRKGIIQLVSGDSRQMFGDFAFGGYGHTILPLEFKDMKFFEHMKHQYVFMPRQDIHMAYLSGSGLHGFKETMFVKVLTLIPNWTKMNQQILGKVLDKIGWMYRSYATIPIAMLGEFVNLILKYKISGEFVSELEWDKIAEDICNRYDVGHYMLNYDFKVLFPEFHLIEKAEELGYKDTEKIVDENNITTLNAFVGTIESGELIPITIKGESYSSYKYNPDPIERSGEMKVLQDFKAIIDDKGNPIIVEKQSRKSIIERDGKLVYTQEIDEYT